jgi:hypothetical protein
MNPFVGVSEQLLSEKQLKDLLQKSSTQPNCYFLRWPHQVKWIENYEKLLEEFPSPEGQMFNYDREFRWKQQGQHFSILLLSTTGSEPGFKPIEQNWKIQQRDAHIYPANETRFPKGLSSTNVDIAQRYFMDADTATVHFVALTVAKKQ